MSTDVTLIDSGFYQLLGRAVKQCLAIVKQLVDEKKYIPRYTSFPEMEIRKNDLPWFSSTIFDFDASPRDYTRALSDREIKLDSHPSFDALLDYVLAHPRLREYFLFDNPILVENAKFWTIQLPKCISNRYIHKYGTTEFMEENFVHLYAEFELGIFPRQLPVEILIPILFVRFDFDDRFELTPEISLEKMNEKLQLARMNSLVGLGYPSANPSIAGSSTHCLSLSNWSIPNDNLLTAASVSLTTPDILHLIDCFFAALRIWRNLDTGYAQLVLRAVSWEMQYSIADLPPVEATSLRAYPAIFESYHWQLENVPMLDSTDIENIKVIFNKLLKIRDNKLSLAIKRLNRCFIREDEEDSILDACMALEALLSDGSTEIQHKLALRICALATLSTNYERSARQTFETMRDIYKYRSALIHGSTNAGKNREIALEEGAKIPAVSAAIDCLVVTP